MSLPGFFTAFRRTRLVWTLWILAALIPEAEAQEKANDASVIYPRTAESRAESHPGGGSSYSGILVAALLLAGAGGWLFWRGRGAPGSTVNVRKLAIAETKSLGNRQYLVVAAYEDKKFLLSVCPGRIELLTRLDGSTTPVQSP
jgi:flagellar protein FliO/FliZ